MSWINKETKKVEFIKGINSDEMMKVIKEKKIKLPIIIHFRIKSVGPIVDSLTHPFPIAPDYQGELSGEADKVLFHNGTWNSWEQDLLKTCRAYRAQIPDGYLSDSRIMAWYCYYYGENFLHTMYSVQKVAVMTKNGIRRFGQWGKVDDIHCSNEGWTPDGYQSQHKIRDFFKNREWRKEFGKWLSPREYKRAMKEAEKEAAEEAAKALQVIDEETENGKKKVNSNNNSTRNSDTWVNTTDDDDDDQQIRQVKQWEFQLNWHEWSTLEHLIMDGHDYDLIKKLWEKGYEMRDIDANLRYGGFLDEVMEGAQRVNS
jgi:hypothetical protein